MLRISTMPVTPMRIMIMTIQITGMITITTRKAKSVQIAVICTRPTRHC